MAAKKHINKLQESKTFFIIYELAKTAFKEHGFIEVLVIKLNPFNDVQDVKLHSRPMKNRRMKMAYSFLQEPDRY